MNPEMQAIADELSGERPELDVQWAGGICPFQSEGTLHGLPYYFRFRHNWAELRIQGPDWFKPLYMAGAEYGEQEDQGWLDPEDFRRLMLQLISELERAPILWQFAGVEPATRGVIRAGTPATYGAWGDTPEQAWAQMHEPVQYFIDKGQDAATQAQWLADRKMSPYTITVDDRIFPDPDPFLITKEDR